MEKPEYLADKAKELFQLLLRNYIENELGDIKDVILTDHKPYPWQYRKLAVKIRFLDETEADTIINVTPHFNVIWEFRFQEKPVRKQSQMTKKDLAEQWYQSHLGEIFTLEKTAKKIEDNEGFIIPKDMYKNLSEESITILENLLSEKAGYTYVSPVTDGIFVKF